MIKLIVDAQTNEAVEIELTQEEIAEREAEANAFNAKKAAQVAEAEARATQKAALLDRLGITEDEAKLLLA